MNKKIKLILIFIFTLLFILLLKSNCFADVDYIELEYIESTGTQYIDTGIIAKSNLSVNANIMFTSLGDDICLLGAGGMRASDRIYLLYSYPRGRFCLGYGSFLTSINTFNIVVNQKYNINSVLSAGEQSLTVDNVNIYSNTLTGSVNSSRPLYLFCCNNSEGGDSYYSSARIYDLQIYSGNNLVRSFIPVKDSNDVICLYDKVSGLFFYNSGSGDFIDGPEITHINPTINPSIANTANDLAGSTYDTILINPGSYTYSDTIKFVLYNVTSRTFTNNGTEYTYDVHDPVFNIVS